MNEVLINVPKTLDELKKKNTVIKILENYDKANVEYTNDEKICMEYILNSIDKQVENLKIRKSFLLPMDPLLVGSYYQREASLYYRIYITDTELIMYPIDMNFKVKEAKKIKLDKIQRIGKDGSVIYSDKAQWIIEGPNFEFKLYQEGSSVRKDIIENIISELQILGINRVDKKKKGDAIIVGFVVAIVALTAVLTFI